MEEALVLGFIIGFMTGSFLIWGGLLLLGIVRIPPGQVLAITQAGTAATGLPHFVSGGTRLLMPFFQRGALYPVRLAPVSRKGLPITRAGVGRLVCDLEADVNPSSDRDGLTRYVQAFGGHEVDEISGIAAHLIENGARQVLMLLPPEQVLADPEWATEQLEKHLLDQLRPLGLELEALRLEARPAPKATRSADASEFSMDGFRAG